MRLYCSRHRLVVVEKAMKPFRLIEQVHIFMWSGIRSDNIGKWLIATK